MNDLTAKHKTVIICTFLLTIPVLQIFGKDIAVFVTVGMAVLAGLGIVIGTTQSVQKQTNGGQAKMLEIMESQNRMLVELGKMMAILPPAPPQPYKDEMTIEGESVDSSTSTTTTTSTTYGHHN